MAKKLTLLIFVIFVSLFFASCNSIKESDEEKQGLNIVTTIPPLYSFVANIIDDTPSTVTNLLPPSSSIHTFQLTPENVKHVESADVIVINGLNLEIFLEDLLNLSQAEIVNTSENVQLLDIKNDQQNFDPHIWLDPDNAIIQVQTIRDVLVEKDPNHANQYKKNSESLIKELKELKIELINRFSKIDIENYIVFHDAYQYFEIAFDLEPIATIEPFPGQQPSPRYLKEVTDLIETENVAVIFTEPQFSPKLVQTLVNEFDLKNAQLDPLGTEISEDSYVKMMRKNVEAFENVFSN